MENIQQILNTIATHLSSRQDLADLISGPEREDWFNAEALCAIGKDRANFGHLSVYGEMSYSHWMNILGISSSTFPDSDALREPDLFCSLRPTLLTPLVNNQINVGLIGEAKLVRRSTDAMPFGKRDQLLTTQLSRAKRFGDICPVQPDIIGILYVLYNSANMFKGDGLEDHECPGLYMNDDFVTAGPNSYFDYVRDRWNGQQSNDDWKLWGKEIQRFPRLANLTPKYLVDTSSLEVGIGIVLHKDHPDIRRQYDE